MTTKSSFTPTSRFAHFLGLDAVAAKTSASVASSAPRAIAQPTQQPVRSIATSAPAARPVPRKLPRAQTETPYADLMDKYRPVQSNQAASEALHVPEMINGVSTGYYIAVPRSRSSAPAPRSDASSAAARVISAGERARSGA